MIRRLAAAALLVASLGVDTTAQDARTVIANASKAMGIDSVGSLTYSGTATNVNFGQTRNIGRTWGPGITTSIANYTRAIDLNQPASRATGTTTPPTIPGTPAPQPGTFNQQITPTTAGWTQQLEIWVTPWGFLKGAASNTATLRSQRSDGKTYNVITWTAPHKAPSGNAYTVVGYVNDQNLVERVETWVEHPILGDLSVDTTYSDYRDFNGLKVPSKIAQKRAGLQTFEASIASATANPANIAELLTPPPAQGAAAGGAPAQPTVESQKLADGVFRITGGYVALALDMGDHVVVLEGGGQNEARGLAIIDATRKAIPNKPIRYMVNSHPHFDHSSGVAPWVAEGITVITHENNKAFLEKALGAPRTLVGDRLAKAPRKPNIEGVGERRILRGANRSVELHSIRDLPHSDGMLVAYLPNEKMLFSADFNLPNPGQAPPNVNPSLIALVQNLDRLKLDFGPYITVHAPNPDRPLTRADLMAAVKRGTN